MSRTNVVIDDELVARVKELYGLRTTREAIDFALRSVAGTTDQLAMLEMKGTGWDGDLAEMRRSNDDDVSRVAEAGERDYLHGSRPPGRKSANRKSRGSRSRKP